MVLQFQRVVLNVFFFKPASAFEILKEMTVLFFEFSWSEVFDFIPYRSAHSL